MSDSQFELLTERSGIYTPMPVKMWTRGVPVEDSAMKQLANIAAMPFIHDHVAAMPDVHWGMGATVGIGHPYQRRHHPGGGRCGHWMWDGCCPVVWRSC